MLGIYNYTVVLTYVGLLTGFSGILLATNGQVKNSLICLMVSGVCDMFDGRIAATLERTAVEKRFGIQIDSLCDLVCFGVLPAIIMCRICKQSLVVSFFAAIYLLCALIRLAWFNVDEEERQNKDESVRKVYMGLPVTTAALIVPSILGISYKYHWPMDRIGSIVYGGMAIAFLSPFCIKKPAVIGKFGMMILGGAGMLMVLMSGMDV